MKLKLSKHWYEVRSKAEEKCMDVSAGMSLSATTKKVMERKATKSAAARTVRKLGTSSKRRAQ